MFNNIYNRRKVLITGHTGFKGSWLALWLFKIGAEVIGYALPPPTEPNHFELLHADMISEIGDIRDAEKLKKVFKEYKPEIVFHLAAQPLVRLSYKDPVETFASNVMGTINVFEASRESGSVHAIVNITSDKCYENREWVWGYREIDPLGGYDPYSASKGCSELITSCWRNSFFNPKGYGSIHQTLLASGRAGNVIGGGDWAVDRLIPDMMCAVTQNEKVKIRNPNASRPWQHVLEPLSGYLLLGQKLLEGRKEFAEAWNFGPFEDRNATVGEIAGQIKMSWPKIDYEIDTTHNQPHEAGMLSLDCSKARTKMQWKPVWNSNTAVEKTTLWYRAFYETKEVLSLDDINSYIADAKSKHLSWVKE
ncbi:MAG: CDP-glucose 4,6-dehydratase [Desulfobacterium sp.]|nr:CDP-glucose 4,6-dehydratase [Desulfobacterium sp.]MBU3949776.1 CDP-glucose 4,6-dehydratase [Pseudomonadota bacterium]MBU4009611.1 CDP-glucose 4,6-dehydratase [Pseudomonadota bacterium]MBU4037325.1 CDP-glucose 4,6-dehydratase [Pseudomonadota bacterium]